MFDEDLKLRFEKYLHNPKVFKKTGLTLGDLAFLMETPAYKISSLLGKHFKINFNAYVNNLRIEYIKQRLDNRDWKQFTLEAIAQDAGFANRNTFFVAFKKRMGVSPSVYLAQLKNSQPN